MARPTPQRDNGNASQLREPEGPTDLRARSWWAVLKRTVREFREDNLTDWAAALTYFGILSIFPALLVLVSVLGLIGESATQPLLDNLARSPRGRRSEIFTSAIQNLTRAQGTAGVTLIIGVAAGTLVGVRLHRRVHARVQRHLRGRRGPPVLQAAAGAARP